MKPIPLIILCSFLCGCEDNKTITNEKALDSAPVPELEGPRFKVETQGSFKAGFENNKREILIITDKKSGRQYLCITDASIAELKAKEAREQAIQDAAEAIADAISNTGN